MQTPALTAHYFAGRVSGTPVKYLIIAEGPSLRGNEGERINVAGKVEARKIAAERGAQCWNF